MPGTYQITLKDPNNTTLAIISDFVSLTYSRKVNDVGTAVLVLPAKYWNYLLTDGRIEIQRSVNGNPFYLEGGAQGEGMQWFIRKREMYLSASGEWLVSCTAFDAVTILNRRNVAYNAGSSQATKGPTAADDMMKAIMAENFGASATDTNRNWSGILSIQSNTTQGQSVSKAFSRRQVLVVLQELAQASTVAGTYLAFDVVVGSGGLLEFRTYKGQRGNDHSLATGTPPLILSPDLGNLAEAKYAEDYTDEATYVYAGGQGQEDKRATTFAKDDARIGLSPFGRIESYQDARNTADPTALQGEANSLLRQKRPKKIFTAKLVDTPATQYGLHYGFGDTVTAQFQGLSFDCRIEAVSVSVSSGGNEQINIALQSLLN